jgi:peptidoglycan-associated lipoprotein
MQRHRLSPSRAFLAALGAAVLLAGCGEKRPPVLTATPGQPAPAPAEHLDRAPARPVDEGPDVRAVGGEGATSADLAGRTGSGEGGPLADVHFAYDSPALSDEARAILEKHALWLQGHRDVKVTVEGQCDERGTVEYNLALGEQRARAARDYLVSLGVAPERLRTVSYGKERPLDPGNNEAAYARNRRAHFAVYR